MRNSFGPIRPGGPILRTPQSSDPLYPKGLTPASPMGTAAAPGALPVNPGTAMPAQRPVSPK